MRAVDGIFIQDDYQKTFPRLEGGETKLSWMENFRVKMIKLFT